jgi:leucyl-tRNA synthetase
VRRLYRLVGDVVAQPHVGEVPTNELLRKSHETIARVTDDLGRRLSFNTAIAAVMELVNELSRAGAADPAARFAAETAVSVIQPYAPHVAEEMWEQLGHSRLWEHAWPVADKTQLQRGTFELVVQVNGKVRDLSRSTATCQKRSRRARQLRRTRAHIEGSTV